MLRKFEQITRIFVVVFFPAVSCSNQFFKQFISGDLIALPTVGHFYVTFQKCWENLSKLQEFLLMCFFLQCPAQTSFSNKLYLDILLFGQLLDKTMKSKLHYKTKGTEDSNPLLIASGERFTQIVVDEDVNSVDVFFIGTGKLLPLLFNINNNNSNNCTSIAPNTSKRKSLSAQRNKRIIMYTMNWTEMFWEESSIWKNI